MLCNYSVNKKKNTAKCYNVFTLNIHVISSNESISFSLGLDPCVSIAAGVTLAP